VRVLSAAAGDVSRDAARHGQVRHDDVYMDGLDGLSYG
jgi:hypothetical protein